MKQYKVYNEIQSKLLAAMTADPSTVSEIASRSGMSICSVNFTIAALFSKRLINVEYRQDKDWHGYRRRPYYFKVV